MPSTPAPTNGAAVLTAKPSDDVEDADPLSLPVSATPPLFLPPDVALGADEELSVVVVFPLTIDASRKFAHVTATI